MLAASFRSETAHPLPWPRRVNGPKINHHVINLDLSGPHDTAPPLNAHMLLRPRGTRLYDWSMLPAWQLSFIQEPMVASSMSNGLYQIVMALHLFSPK